MAIKELNHNSTCNEREQLSMMDGLPPVPPDIFIRQTCEIFIKECLKQTWRGEISELMTLTNGQGGVFRDSASLHQLVLWEQWKLSATQDLARWPNIPARRILINQSEQNSVLTFQIYPDVQCIVQKKMFLFSFANCLHLLGMMKSRTLAVVYLWCS